MKLIKSHFSLFLLLYIPHIFLIFLLLEKYPHTGLGRIIAIPMTLIVNIIIAYFGCYFIDRAKDRNRQITLIIATFFTIFIITLTLYPQDYPSSVIIKLINDIFNK